jgi:hypothetical protein
MTGYPLSEVLSDYIQILMRLFHPVQKLKCLLRVLRGRKALFGIRMAMEDFLLNLYYSVTFQTIEFIAGTKKQGFLSFLNRPALPAQRVMEENEEATASHSMQRGGCSAASMATEGSVCLKKMVGNEHVLTHGMENVSTARMTWLFIHQEPFISLTHHTDFLMGLMMHEGKSIAAESFDCSQTEPLTLSVTP